MPSRTCSDQTRTQRIQANPVRLLLFTLVGLIMVLLVTGMNSTPGSSCFADSKGGTKDAPTPPAKKTGHSITLYVTSWCPACSMAINYLKQKNIPFTVKDVEKNPDYLKEMVAKIGGYRGVPVVDIDGKTYLGFHPSMVDDLSN